MADTLELIKTLPLELRERILKEYIKIKLRERRDLGWDEVNESILSAPYCLENQQITWIMHCYKCLALAIVRGVAPLSTIELARMEKKVDIPKAPPVGLFLDEVHFDAYNRRYGDDGMHETMAWDENEEEIQQFKDQFIFKHIIDTEAREHVMMRWLKTLPDHSYTNERMDEIHPKTDQDSAKQETSINTDNTASSDDHSCPGGSSDTIQVTEGGESNKSEQSERLEDVSAAM